jgi:hypothetical protein
VFPDGDSFLRRGRLFGASPELGAGESGTCSACRREFFSVRSGSCSAHSAADINMRERRPSLSPVDLSQGRARKTAPTQPAPLFSIGTANREATTRAGRPLIPSRRRCRLRRTVFMERDRSKMSSRAGGAQFAHAWRRVLALVGVVELPGTPRTTRVLPRDRNLQLRRSLAQSHRRTCFIPGDEGIVVPVCVADTLSGLEPGSAAQLPKAVVHLHNSGINALLISSAAQIHPGNNRILRHSSSAATHRQQPAPDAVLPRAPQLAWRSRAHWLAAALCGNHLQRQLADHN